MKKIISLGLLLVALAGCNKTQKYENELQGTWTVDNYLLNNINAYSLFQQQYKNYTISFTSGGAYTESYTVDSMPFARSGTYHFINHDQGIALDYIMIDTLTVDSTIVIVDSTRERQYTLFDLTGASVQFLTDTSREYLVKNP